MPICGIKRNCTKCIFDCWLALWDFLAFKSVMILESTLYCCIGTAHFFQKVQTLVRELCFKGFKSWQFYWKSLIHFGAHADLGEWMGRGEWVEIICKQDYLLLDGSRGLVCLHPWLIFLGCTTSIYLENLSNLQCRTHTLSKTGLWDSFF